MLARLAGLLVVSFAVSSFAENAERGQRQAEEEVLPKLNLLCGGTFTVSYDLDSLKANNQDIRYDQTDGALQCDEPLRILWTLCQTEAGKALVRRNELREVRCVGVKGSEGSLTVKNGVITVGRAFEEGDAHLRARVQFEKALKTKVTMKSADPYYDDAWRAFRQAPAPVTSTTDYCLVNGEKQKYSDSAAWSVRDGSVKCLKAGVVVIDLTVKDGKGTGVTRRENGDGYQVEHETDGRRDGVTEDYRHGQLIDAVEWRKDRVVWSKKFYDSGALKAYTRNFETGTASLNLAEDGRVQGLSCRPEAKSDEVLHDWCGFSGARTVHLYDGTNKVNAIRTFHDGVLEKEEPGDSRYAARTAVGYEGGKKHGVERITREDGTLERTVTWKAGEQEGPEEVYAKDGKRVIERLEWRGGEQVGHSFFFLNGNVKSREAVDGNTRSRTSFFDLGQMESEQHSVRCGRRDWCEDGVEKHWFENGKLSSETHWKQGKREGTAKGWFENGKPAFEETWVGDLRTQRRSWDEKGTLTADDEFEEDGSRKVKR